MPHATLTPDLASRYADIALGHVGREYPNKLDHVLTQDADAQAPRELHPIFYGSFYWHSCVHGYWMLAVLLRRFPEGAAAARIASRFDKVFTPEKVAGELAFLQRPLSAGFERPYGWAWLLALGLALKPGGPYAAAHFGPGLDDPSRWSEAMQPLTQAFAARFKTFLPKADYPVRTGAHANTAFALRLAFDYAETFGDGELVELIRDRAGSWYGGTVRPPPGSRPGTTSSRRP